MNTTLRIACAVAALIIGSSAAATEYAIGQLGATVDLDASWQRKSFNPDLGRDQFVHDSGVFAMILEDAALLERRSDFEARLKVFLASIEARAESIELEPEMSFTRAGRIGRCTQRLTLGVMSMQLAYQLDLVNRDGLGYLVMTWSQLTKTLDLAEQASQLATAIAFPGPDTDWGKSAEPTTHRFRFDDWTVELDYRDSVLPELDTDTEGIYSLTNSEETVAVHLLLGRLQGKLEAALDEVVALVDEDGSMEELGRSDLEHALGRGRQTLLRESSGQEQFDLALAVIPLSDEVYLDLRFVSMGVEGHRQRLWEELLAALTVVPPAVVDAFPQVEEELEPAASTLNPAAQALLDGCALVGATRAGLAQLVLRGDGEVVALEPRRVVRLVAGAEAEVLLSSEEWIGGQRLTVLGGDLLLLGGKAATVTAVTDGDLVPLPYSARRGAAAGERLVLLRRDDGPEMVGFEELANLNPDRLIVRSGDGSERVVTSLDDLETTAMAAVGDGSAVLVAAAARRLLSGPAAGRELQLVEVDLRSSRRRPLGSWTNVRHLAGSRLGWLVSGTPEDGTAGLYLVTAPDPPELLLSGDSLGVGMIGDDLVFSVDHCLSGGDEGSVCVYRGPLALVRRLGPSFRPLSTETVNRIAAEVAQGAGPLPPSTRAEVAARRAAASAASERLAGVPLPSTKAAVDHWLRTLMGETGLSDEAISLLTLVLVDTLLDAGAEWVAPTAGAGPTWGTGNGEVGDNAFALAVDPQQVVISTLFQEEGWWDPATSLPEQADGRRLLLGYDLAALEAALAASVDERVEAALATGTIDTLIEVLGAHPDNVSLRARVYRHLAASGAAAALVAVGGHFVARPAAAAADQRAWLAGRLHLGADGAALDLLVADLRAAVASHPEEASLYILLGTAYERGTAADRLQLARACYAKAAELATWGEMADAAEAALARVEEAL